MRATVSVRAFGPLMDVFSGGSLEIDLPADGKGLRRSLEKRWPGLAGHHYAIAVNQTILRTGQTVAEANEIALLPPFAGG